MLKRIQAVRLTMSAWAIPRLMKWLAAARLGMRWPQVISTPTERRGTRRLIWPCSCLRLLFTSARLANGRPTSKMLKIWRFVMLLPLQVAFHEIAWALDRWRCARCQRYARNNSTPAALRRTACVPLFGGARGATPSLPRVHLSHKVRRSGPITWCTMCGAYSSNRSFALRQCCPGSCPYQTRSQRLRQLVIGRHPITGAWLLDDATQAL